MGDPGLKFKTKLVSELQAPPTLSWVREDWSCIGDCFTPSLLGCGRCSRGGPPPCDSSRLRSGGGRWRATGRLLLMDGSNCSRWLMRALLVDSSSPHLDGDSKTTGPCACVVITHRRGEIITYRSCDKCPRPLQCGRWIVLCPPG